jgi:hypothetical protein
MLGQQQQIIQHDTWALKLDCPNSLRPGPDRSHVSAGLEGLWRTLAMLLKLQDLWERTGREQFVSPKRGVEPADDGSALGSTAQSWGAEAAGD